MLEALGRPEVQALTWRATLAGGGPIEDYRKIARELGLEDRVSFPGWLDGGGVRALFDAADLVVLPSHAEGLAMAVLEGLSHGLPVVTTPVGAHEEVIETERSGLLVPPGDVDALARALVRVINDPDLRRHLGAGARARFLEGFEVHGYARRLSQIHQSLLTAGSVG